MRRCSIRILPLVLLSLTFAAGSGRLIAQKLTLKRVVGTPPTALKLDAFYEKYADAEGLPVVSSKNVPDEALVMAAELVANVLATRPDLRKALAEGNVRIAVMSERELTTDLPEHSQLRPKNYWDRRARGLGGTPHIPTTSCAEENLLGYPNDPYNGESILIHEFAHTVHEVGLKVVDKDFDDRLKTLYNKAMEAGHWKNTYAATDHKEYWAESVQSYFDCNLHADPPDGTHNHVRTREQLQAYDPDVAKLIDEVFANNSWRWVSNGAHQRKWRKS